MLSPYFLIVSCPGPRRPVCSVAEWVIRREAGSLDLNSLEDRDVVPVLLCSSGEEGVVEDCCGAERVGSS